MTTTPQLPFPCIKQSTKRHQVKRTTSIAALMIREPSAATLQEATSPRVASYPGKRQPPSGWAVAFFSFSDAAPLLWTASTSSAFTVDSAFIVHPASFRVGMW